jgi:DNA-binding transcriptional LysR family regulator
MPASSEPFRVAFVPGVTPGKWARIWSERTPDVPLELVPVTDREQVAVLHDGSVHMSFVRLPVDREGLNLIPLYKEVPVVVVPQEHPVSVFDEISLDDLADELLLQDPDARQAIETVAAGTGIVILPKSVARLYNRKDVVSRPVTGVAESQVCLTWLVEAVDPRIETFIGIVRGRTERSSRDAANQQTREKTAGRQSGGRTGKDPGGRVGKQPAKQSGRSGGRRRPRPR